MEGKICIDLVDTLSDALLAVDQDGRVIVWNPKAEEMFGYTKSEIQEKGLEAIIPESYRQKHREAYNRFLRDIDTYSSYVSEVRELEGLRKSGEIFPIEMTRSLLKITNKEFYFTTIIRDITLRKHYYLMKERVERITRHDLKNKLVILSLALKRLADCLQAPGDSQIFEYIEILQNQTISSLKLLDSTRELILLETGEYKGEYEFLDVVEVITRVCEEMKPMAVSKGVKIGVYNFLKRPNLSLRADRALLERALENLIKNAIEAEEPSGRVEVNLREDKRRIPLLEILNRGKPIPEELHHRIFKPYVTHGKEGGTGLGLYSARLILEEFHGWRLTFVSNTQATVFTIAFTSSASQGQA